MADRNNLTQYEKYFNFKKAHGTYKMYLEQKNYIGAYVIAFSIFEDRVNAMFFVRKIKDKIFNPKVRTPLIRKLKYLLNHSDISEENFNIWEPLIHNRNNKLHAAMWNIDEFLQVDCEEVLKMANLANTLRSKQKRLLQVKKVKSKK